MKWENCLEHLKQEISNQEFNTWIRPLQAMEKDDQLVLLAPNKFVIDWVNKKYIKIIKEFLISSSSTGLANVVIEVGSLKKTNTPIVKNNDIEDKRSDIKIVEISNEKNENYKYIDTINSGMTFNNFVEGKCNMLARAAGMQIVDHINSKQQSTYNPFLIYGGVGLGKTHLMHAIGNIILTKKPNAKVLYLHSEKFVQDMVVALQNRNIEKFKSFYRSVDALLIDDIQFFAKKERSQEEFFHTFNSLLEEQKQIIMTCDTYPKEVEGIEERLISRFGWGLSVGIELPDVETRVAILISKAKQLDTELPHDVAFFIAQRIQSNIRELEGALRRVIATARFTRKTISVEFAKKALHDLLSIQEKQITVDNIQKIVAEYYKIRVSELNSKKRSRSIARPRQIAMALSKELTNHSLPEIGEFFGGRDHTTVLHGCKKVAELLVEDARVSEDFNNIKRILTG